MSEVHTCWVSLASGPCLCLWSSLSTFQCVSGRMAPLCQSPWLTPCRQMPLSGPRPWGWLHLCHPACGCLLLPCLAFLGHTCLCLFSFCGGGSLQISPAIFVLLPGPHLSPLVFSGCLCLSGEISVYLSLHLRHSIAVLRPISLCVWTSLPGSGSLQPPPSLFLKASLRSHLQPPSSAPRLPISLPATVHPGPPALQPGPVLNRVCLPRRPAEEVEGGPRPLFGPCFFSLPHPCSLPLTAPLWYLQPKSVL